MNTLRYPCAPVRSLVLFPGQSTQLSVGRDFSKAAAMLAHEKFGGMLVLLTQRRQEQETRPLLEDLYPIGTLCKIEGKVTLSDGGVVLMVHGLSRFSTHMLAVEDAAIVAVGTELPELPHAVNDELWEKIVGSLGKVANPLNFKEGKTGPSLLATLASFVKRPEGLFDYCKNEPFNLDDARKLELANKFIEQIWAAMACETLDSAVARLLRLIKENGVNLPG